MSEPVLNPVLNPNEEVDVDDPEYLEYLQYLEDKKNRDVRVVQELEDIEGIEEVEEIKPKGRMTKKGKPDKRSISSAGNVSKARGKVRAYLDTAKKLLNEKGSDSESGDEYVDVVLRSKKQDEIDRIKPEPTIIKREPLKKLIKQKKIESIEIAPIVAAPVVAPIINEIEIEKQKHKEELEQIKKEVEELKKQKLEMKSKEIENLRSNFLLKF